MRVYLETDLNRVFTKALGPIATAELDVVLTHRFDAPGTDITHREVLSVVSIRPPCTQRVVAGWGVGGAWVESRSRQVARLATACIVGDPSGTVAVRG